MASTPVKQLISVDPEMSTVSKIGTSLTRSTFTSLFSVTKSKISFMDMVAADIEGDEGKFIKEFDGWFDTQSFVDTVKHISPDIPLSKFQSMSYDDLWVIL